MNVPPIAILLDLQRTAPPRRGYDNPPYVTTESISDRVYGPTRRFTRSQRSLSATLRQRSPLPSACDELSA